MIMRARAALSSLPLLTGACDYQNYQSTFANAGEGTQHFNTLFTIFLVVCAFMYLLVIGFLFTAIARRRRSGEANVVEEGRHHNEHPLLRPTLIGWGALVSVGLIILAVASFVTDSSDAQAAGKEVVRKGKSGLAGPSSTAKNPGKT